MAAEALAWKERRNQKQIGGDFEVLATPTRAYNHIAHSLGRHDQWINPQTGAPDDPLQLMDRCYALQGYTRAPVLDLGLTAEVRKVVVYALHNADGSILEITHAALQEPDGTWSSKLGHGPLIRHATAEALAGPAYGAPVAVYVRQRPLP